MILTSTYRDRTTVTRDLLAAFSPLDHSTTATLTGSQLENALDRLLRRLVVLVSLHGPGTARSLLGSLASLSLDADAVDVTAAFLEHGIGEATDCPSEIQQELLHFSRIVDIGHLGLSTGIDEHALRRLRGSTRLPDSLKVLSELVIVTRARLAQRGRLVPRPRLRPAATVEADPSADLTTTAPSTSPDYWMAVRCDRRRIRRQIRYELSALLTYLTPVEAALVLWAHVWEQQLPDGLQLALAQADVRAGTAVVQWNYQPGTSPADGEVIAHVAQQLPAITQMLPGGFLPIDMGQATYGIHASSDLTAEVTETPAGRTLTTLTAANDRDLTPTDLAARACELLAAYHGPDLSSIEAGHIHLDRKLDQDQDTGTVIGAALTQVLAGRQAQPPLLTPMMDDDHVLIRLSPAVYRTYLERTFGAAPMFLVCESSPIIRAIVVALFQRMNGSSLATRYQRRGGNLFLPLADGAHIELFEGVDGPAPATGCVLFEAALLIYRCDPARFDQYFIDRYRLPEGVHDRAAAILSTNRLHDDKAAELARYYTAFSDVTDPSRPDRDVATLVSGVLEDAAPVTAHLNVLEDYYEVQQRRVRELLRLIGLPLRLVTIHFSAVTGRMVCDG